MAVYSSAQNALRLYPLYLCVCHENRVCLCVFPGFNRWRPVTLEIGGDGESVASIFKSKAHVCFEYLDVCSQNIIPVSPKHVVSSEPNRRRYPKGACILNRGQTQLRDDSQRVPEAGPSGENRGGEEAVGGGGKNTSKSLIHGQTKELCLDMHGALSN